MGKRKREGEERRKMERGGEGQRGRGREREKKKKKGNQITDLVPDNFLVSDTSPYKAFSPYTWGP